MKRIFTLRNMAAAASLLLGLGASELTAQTSYYQFTGSTLNYQPLSNPTTLIQNPWFIGTGTFFTPPFSISFYGQQYDSMYVSVDGWIGFNNPSEQDTRVDVFRTPTKGTSTFDSRVWYEVSGTAGSRVLKIEWKSCVFDASPSGTDGYSVTIFFYENSPCFQINAGTIVTVSNSVYDDPSTSLVENGPIIGIRDETFPDLMYLTSDPTTPTVYTDLNLPVVNPVSLTGGPSGNTLYRFCPAAVSSDAPLEQEIDVFYQSGAHTLELRSQKSLTVGSIQVFDCTGRLVSESKGGTGNRFSVPAEGLSSGVYILRIEAEGQQMQKRVFIQE